MVFNNIDNCCWDSNLQVTFTGLLFPTEALPDPPDALLLATATMSPTQMMVSPAMVATRRPWTLFMILTHSG